MKMWGNNRWMDRLATTVRTFQYLQFLSWKSVLTFRHCTFNLTIAGLPHPFGSHLIISDDLKMLEEKLERRIPTGYIIINGRATATQKFCEAVQMGKPVFVFKVRRNSF